MRKRTLAALVAAILSTLVLAVPAIAVDGDDSNNSSNNSSNNNNNNNNNTNQQQQQQQQQMILIDEGPAGDADGGCDHASSGVNLISVNLPIGSCNSARS